MEKGGGERESERFCCGGGDPGFYHRAAPHDKWVPTAVERRW